MEKWEIKTGYSVNAETGMLEKNAETAATVRVYRAMRGDRLFLCDEGCEYAVFFYLPEVDKKYIYTYDYESEQKWVTFRRKSEENKFRTGVMKFDETIYFRVVVRRKECQREIDSAEISAGMEKAVRWEKIGNGSGKKEGVERSVFETETKETVLKTRQLMNGTELAFVLMSDIHYTVGGTWKTTVQNVNEVQKQLHMDGCIHLGDATDGMISAELNREYVVEMKRDIAEMDLPLYYVIGNHDSNYFRGNPERFCPKEMYELYLENGGHCKKNSKARECFELDNKVESPVELWYHVDMPNQKLRMIFLDSFDPAEDLRYGFAEEELDWLQTLLEGTRADWYTVIFSHVPPVPRMHFWSDEIRGSKRLVEMLRQYQRRSNNRLMGFVHGHNHADSIDLREGFPVISVGCAKCEYFEGKKPKDSRTYYRELGTVLQELWDVLLISTEREELNFIRFGAGEDRTVGCGEKFGWIRWGEKNEDKSKEARIPMKKVITYGTFDLFHEGHYNLLKRAKALGDYLIVGVTTEHYDEQRGKINIVDSMLERIENVRKCGFADEIIIEDHEGQKIEDIQKYNVDIFTLGSDWKGMFDYLKEYCQVVYLERTPDISSTMIRNTKFPIVSLGIVGTGRIAPRFIAEAKYVSGVNVQSAFNPNKDGVRAFAREFELKPYSECFEEFLDSVDAIYIAAPHETHYDYAKRALLARKSVLCEKPLAFSKKEAKELFALARENGVVLMEGIKTAYCPGFAELIHIAKSGRIGEIVDVEACFSRLTDPGLREMVDEEYGGAFLEFGSYTVLPIIKLLGTNYKDVRFSSIQAENGVDLYTKVYFDYMGGMATSKTGIGVKSEGQLLVSGTKGYILAESPWWLTRKFQVRYENPDEIESYTPKFLGDGLRYEISEFISRINGRNRGGNKLTETESVAMADVVERFMKKRAK